MNKKMFSLIFFIKNNYKDEVYVIFFLKIFVPYYLVDHGSMIKKKKKRERERIMYDGFKNTYFLRKIV
jgi:hypothetical protein